MAEVVVSFVVKKLGDYLIQEATFLYSVRDQVEWVERELRCMQCFLKDADAKQRKGDERVKNWVKDITDVAYQAEDAIDTFMLQVERRPRQQGFLRFIQRYANTPSMLIARREVGKEIERIKIKILAISASRVTYGIANLGEIGGDQGRHESLEARKRLYPNLNDDTDSIVGFDVFSKDLVSRLLDTKPNRRCIFSIVGTGGLGKTTLAKKVLHSKEIVVNFPVRIWTTVSQDYQTCEILKSIANEAMGTSTDDLKKMEEEEVKKKLHEFLKDKIYLIVMDDIWSTDVWIKINKALPNGMNGSRVLITTRLIEVAESADQGIQPLILPFLNDDESWELFTKKVFPTSSCPEELNELGRQMVKKCSGLPLALLVLGGILSRKRATSLVWLHVLESMDWESTKDGKECMDILALSYDNLPNHHLKCCFLYMGFFPEDSKISASRLARLWIAEGFVSQRESETMEDTASGYLEELVQRSMIQVVTRRIHDGEILRCRIHDLMREMCLREAKQVGFLNFINSSDSSVPASRRLALANLTGDSYSRYLTPNLRSLHLTDGHDNLPSMKSPHGLKLLRVLVMCDMSLKSLKEIDSMTHLRYLEVRSCKILSFIGRFRYLQTLVIWGPIDPKLNCYYYCMLPKELELPNLRYLFIYQLDSCIPHITASTKLQTLKYVNCNKTWIERNLSRLTNLRRLSMFYDDDPKTLLYAAFGKLCLLAYLSLETDELSAESILAALAQNRHLYNLQLEAKILERRLPPSSVFPPNLTILYLGKSKLEQDPMPVLEKLPNLMSLQLYPDAYVGEELVCTSGGFPRLRYLSLAFFSELKHWIVEDGSFPNLTCLHIIFGESLTMLPDGLQYMTSLKELTVIDDREEFIDKLREGGEDWYKIKHVPSIIRQALPGPMTSQYELSIEEGDFLS